MPTLSELAKTQQTTTVGSAQVGAVGGAGGTNIQPVTKIDRTAGLIKDIGKMFGKTVESKVEASEYTGKRVGIDNLAEYKKNMDIIQLEYVGKEDLTSTDMIEKSRLEQGLYEHFMQQGSFGEDSLANQAFRDTYAIPATDNLFNTKIANEKQRVALFASEEDTAIQNEIETIGIDFSVDKHLDAYRTRMSVSNNNPDKVDKYVAKSFNVDANKMYDINRDLLIYNADGSVNNELQMEAFNTIYGKVVKIDETGNVVKTELNDVGTTDIINNWRKLVEVKRSTSGNIDLKFVSTTANVGEGVTVVGKKLTNTLQQVNNMNAAEAKGLGKVSLSTRTTSNKKIAELNSIVHQANNLNNAVIGIFKGDNGAYKEFDKDTKVEYEYVNATTNAVEKDIYTMTKDQKTSRLNDGIRSREDDFDNPNVPIDTKLNGVIELVNAENVTGVKSNALTRKVTNLNNGQIQGKTVTEKYHNFLIAQTKVANSSVPYIGWTNKKTLDAIGVGYQEAIKALSDENLSMGDKNKLEQDLMISLDSTTRVHKNNYETNKFTSGESKIVHTALVDSQETKFFELKWGDAVMSSATMKTVTDGAIFTAAGSINNDNVDDVVQKYQDNNMIKLSNEYFGKDGQMIVKPQGYVNQSTGPMLDRITKDIEDGLKGTEYTDINLEDATQAQLNSYVNPEGIVSTVVIVRHNVTGDILYTREYHGGELVKGITVEEKKK